MATFISGFRDAARKRAEYRRTLRALRTMPLETMIDFDIDPRDFDKMARDAVYGG